MTDSDKMQAAACQRDAAQKALYAKCALALGDTVAATYWQHRASYYAGMARYFMGMR